MKKIKIALSMIVITMGLSITIPTIEAEASSKTEVSAKKTTPANPTTKTAPKAVAKTNFKNCTEMRKVHPKGVKKRHPAYQKKHDRDNDGWACEVETKAKKK